MLDEFDGDPDAEFPAPGVPPAPSVTPGSAPPPPSAITEEQSDAGGCLLLVGLAAAAAFVLLLVTVALVIVGVKFFGSDGSAEDAKVLQDVFIETGIASASTDAAHPPQNDIKLGACEGDGNGGIRAAGTVTNWTNAPADYRIDVSFRTLGGGSSGEEFAARIVDLTGVAEHSTTEWSAVVEDPPTGGFACRIVAVNRWRAGTGPRS